MSWAGDALARQVLRHATQHMLLFNQCWEDPRLDLEAMTVGPQSRLVMIASAGCNALDYAIAGCGEVLAVDLNPWQIALCKLKAEAIRVLDYEQFFGFFGEGGGSDHYAALYRRFIRRGLDEKTRRILDRAVPRWFGDPSPRRRLYSHGITGKVSRALRAVLRLDPTLFRTVQELLEVRDLEQQRALYRRARPRILRRPVRACVNSDLYLAFHGVPHTQAAGLRQESGSVAMLVEEALDAVFGELPLWENYFWSAYLRGHYVHEACPRYLTPGGFSTLKEGAIDAVSFRTEALVDTLKPARANGDDRRFTHAVLLDHQDWLAGGDCRSREILAAEWRHLTRACVPGATILFRSACREPAYINELRVTTESGVVVPLTALLEFDRARAAELHQRDRVHTYGGFHIATLRPC